MNIEQRNNCIKLAKYLLTLPENYEQFDMKSYCSSTKPPQDLALEGYACGTTACALGYGPAAGVKPSFMHGRDFHEAWGLYSLNMFGLDIDTEDWDWCFSEFWEDVDNTPQGAGKRIGYLLEGKVDGDAYVSVDSKKLYKDYTPDWSLIEGVGVKQCKYVEYLVYMWVLCGIMVVQMLSIGVSARFSCFESESKPDNRDYGEGKDVFVEVETLK